MLPIDLGLDLCHRRRTSLHREHVDLDAIVGSEGIDPRFFDVLAEHAVEVIDDESLFVGYRLCDHCRRKDCGSRNALDDCPPSQHRHVFLLSR